MKTLLLILIIIFIITSYARKKRKAEEYQKQKYAEEFQEAILKQQAISENKKRLQMQETENMMYLQAEENIYNSQKELTNNESKIEISSYHNSDYSKKINKFNPYNVDKTIKKDTALTEIEAEFLDYVNNLTIYEPYIAKYWSYKYHINFCNIMSRFFNEGYLRISDEIESLQYLKVPELKNILKMNNLKVSGKKSELISRIIDNIPANLIKELTANSDKHYVLTEKGTNVVKNIEHRHVNFTHKAPSEQELINSTLSTIRLYKSLGVEKYEFIATLDTETCKVCGKLDTKVFELKNAVPGKNCPPMHDGCRCVITPFFDDEYSDLFNDGAVRAARNPETGKTEYVPADMTYKEWAKKYLNK